MKNTDEIIKELLIEKQKILQEFDFAKVAALFKVLGYSYVNGDVPEETELISIANRLLDDAINGFKENMTPVKVSTGRLISFVHDFDSAVELELVFDPCGVSRHIPKD